MNITQAMYRTAAVLAAAMFRGAELGNHQLAFMRRALPRKPINQYADRSKYTGAMLREIARRADRQECARRRRQMARLAAKTA